MPMSGGRSVDWDGKDKVHRACPLASFNQAQRWIRSTWALLANHSAWPEEVSQPLHSSLFQLGVRGKGLE